MTSSVRSFWLAVFVVYSAFSAILVSAESLFGQSANQHPLPPEKAFAIGSQQVDGKLAVVWNVADGYYLYQDKISVTLAGTDITSGVELPKAKLKDDPLFGSTYVYYGQLSAMLNLPQATAGEILTVGYQGCWEGGVCYPPQTHDIALQAVSSPSPISQPDALAMAAESVVNDHSGVTGTDASWFTKQLASAGVSTVIITFFLAGLGLALTPCVLPMVPILSNLIVGMKPKPGPVKSFFLSLTYVLAMAVTYALAGVAAGLSGANLQAALQHPAVITVMVLLFLVFAAAMFDWITVQMPAGIQNRLNNFNQQQSSGHFMGVGVMGVVSALVVGPCVAAPLAGALLYISQTGDPYTGGLALLALGLGMGVPLLVVGTSAGKLVPRAGAWMNRVKYGFGFLMLYMAIWMLDRIAPSATVSLVMLVTLTGALLFWQAHRWAPPVASVFGRAMVYVTALLMSTYSVALLVSMLAGQPSLISPLQGVTSVSSTVQSVGYKALPKLQAEQVPGLLQQAQALNKPVLIDFYADWCISCKELDSFVFPDAQVQAALQGYVVIKVDVTDNSQADRDLLAKYDLVGPPGLLLINKQGEWLRNETIVGVPSPQQFAQALRRVARQ
ncbi:MAG TPA: protein-disulfide reductase DsbD [Oceanospirillaceae bacterium]|nr:protein-disulfide reductase DsbD [Oceanospirillaceae bacterium]